MQSPDARFQAKTRHSRVEVTTQGAELQELNGETWQRGEAVDKRAPPSIIEIGSPSKEYSVKSNTRRPSPFTRSRRARNLIPPLRVLVSGLLLAPWIVCPVAGQDLAFRRGDSNEDGRVDLADPIRTLRHVFQGEATPPCLDAADANDDGSEDISDAIFTLLYLFQGGAPPPAPFPDPGQDATPLDGLDCAIGME